MSDWMKDTTATVQNARLRSLADIQIGVRRVHRPIILAQSKETGKTTWWSRTKESRYIRSTASSTMALWWNL